MSVFFLNERKVFHLSNSEISYLFRLTEDGHIQDLYYGNVIGRDEASDTHTYANEHYDEQLLIKASYGETPKPTGITLFRIFTNNGRDIPFTYVGYSVSGEILEDDTDELKDSYAENLNIIFHSDETDTDIISTYTIIAGLPVITRRITVIQNGEQTIHMKIIPENIAHYKDLYTSNPPTENDDFDLKTGERFESPDMIMLFHHEDTDK